MESYFFNNKAMQKYTNERASFRLLMESYFFNKNEKNNIRKRKRFRLLMESYFFNNIMAIVINNMSKFSSPNGVLLF